jgi:hypothetical protein
MPGTYSTELFFRVTGILANACKLFGTGGHTYKHLQHLSTTTKTKCYYFGSYIYISDGD